MALAGYCRGCGQYVWLNEQWGCVNGHPWTEIGNWYDPQHGTPVTPYWLQPAPSSGAPVPPATPQPAAAAAPDASRALGGGRSGARRSAHPTRRHARHPRPVSQLRVAVRYGHGHRCSNEVANASWGTGTRKIESSAIMKAVEAERTIYYWETLKESGTGPNGAAMKADWGYAAARRIVEDVAARHGWQVKVVLKKNSAQW